jgi:DNA-binding NtrC family response regulator
MRLSAKLPVGSHGRKGPLPCPRLCWSFHNEQKTRDRAVTALRAASLEVIGFDDPMAALDAMEADSHVRVLVTRVDFGSGKLDGVALARMVRFKRPGTRVVFIARAEYKPPAEGLGVFLPMPLNPDILVATVGRLLALPRNPLP